METFQVKFLRPALKEAALGVGYSEEDTITCHGALRAWAQWELGDPQWAEDFISYRANPCSQPL